MSMRRFVSIWCRTSAAILSLHFATGFTAVRAGQPPVTEQAAARNESDNSLEVDGLDATENGLPADAAANPTHQEAPLPGALAAPRDLKLIAKDRVVVHCTYWAGNRGKKTVPIILLHGWDGKLGAGSRQDLLELGQALQKAGHAVIAPDLRGHGQSDRRELSENDVVMLDREAFRSQDINDMLLDVEAARRFLVEENNAERLNLECLTVIGFDMSTVVALNWILFDWTMPSFPTLKQGQDVKAFVLVSPDQAFRGMGTRQALSNPIVRGQLSACVIYGADDPAADAAKRIVNTLRRAHRPIPANPDDAVRFQDFYVHELATRLHGTKLLNGPTLGLSEAIAQFIERRLVAQQVQFPWRKR
ncbi:MAG: alpha/beta fold hydrolase [Planctomycetales bacterium]|nr:alpha/beta fold hydrolase [Planctomycetales bacterium]